MKKTKSTNPELVTLIQFLKRESRENKVKIWRSVAKCLAKSRRNRVTVNISRLNRHTEKGETIIVPGKVLGAGRINHPITVAALTFSEKAEEKIRAAKGKTLSFLQLVKKNPRGSDIKTIG